MSNFEIKKGKYHVPKVGFVDATKEVGDETAFKLYQLPRRIFPFIELGEDGMDFLSSKKLTAKEVAKMVLNARTETEAKELAKLSDTKTVDRVLETKLNALAPLER
ncbi:hypothetical protein MG296_10610 [Flavobacteriaceae bacterium TK19130]|nr:hypothetical protein [Thermobacterium salinum]